MVTEAGPSVVVLGGGVIGLSIAIELAAQSVGCSVVDPSPGRGASWAAAGMLSAAAEVAPGEEALLADLADAAARWPAYAQRVGALSGGDVGFEPSGSILVGRSQSDVREAARFAEVIRRAGIPVEFLEGSALAEQEPSLVGGLRGAWLLEGDHRVDNRRLVASLLVAVKAMGVAVLEDRCIRVAAGSSAITCTLEHQGDVVADRCVIATGATPLPAGLEGLGVPTIRPVRGATLRCTSLPGSTIPTRTVRGIVDGMHCYLVPRGTRELVVGATSEEQGYARLARAGGVYELLDAARQLLPGLDELSLDEVAVGLRPATEDHIPVVGALVDERIVVALGHYRNGVLLAPLAAARAVAALGISA